MTIERKIASLFNLTDENWMKHSNPISVWTRYSVLPIIVIAFWSRIWIGWWCLVPGLIALLWMFFNPVLFKKPKSTKNWASKAVLELNVATAKAEGLSIKPALLKIAKVVK